MDSEIATQHAILLSRTNGARARRVMSPGIVANKVLQLLRSLHIVSGFFFHHELFLCESGGKLANKFDTVEHTLQVLISTFFEIAEIDVRRITRIGRAQSYVACPISCMRLQHDPGEIVKIFSE